MDITKQEIIKAFKKENIPFTKIAKSKLGGFYVYTHYGSLDHYMKYTIVKKEQNIVTKRKEQIAVKRCFIDNEDLLYMAIVESKNRMKYEY